MMLTPPTRAHFHTLRDARAFTAPDLDAPAIIYRTLNADPVTISRGKLLHHIQQTATALLGLGVKTGDGVIIAHTQNLEGIYAFWGAIFCGAVPSMFPTLTEKLDPTLYQEQMAQLVRHAGARAVLTSDEFAPQLANIVPCDVYNTTQLRAAPADAHPHIAHSAEMIALLQHSSGTTGLQKGVALSHEAILNQLAHLSAALDLAPDDVIVSWLPLYHDMGLIAGFLLPIVQGIPLVLMSPFEWVRKPVLLLHALHDHQGTLCWLPNFAYNHCVRGIRQQDTADLDLSRLRAFINCSEPVQHASHQLFLERFAANGVRPSQLHVSYAMAENTFAVTQTALDAAPTIDQVDAVRLEEDRIAAVTDQQEGARRLVSCGKPITGTQVRILDEYGHDLPERHVGEIAIQSDCMLTGYYHRPDLNANLFLDGWFHTGDMGYLADGELYVIGRQKDVIINAGKNLYPADLEAMVNRVPGVHPGRVVVFGVQDERSGTELIAVLAEVDSSDQTEKQRIQREIRRVISQEAGVAATYIELVPPRWLIKTSSGKIARNENRRRWQHELQQGT